MFLFEHLFSLLDVSFRVCTSEPSGIAEPIRAQSSAAPILSGVRAGRVFELSLVLGVNFDADASTPAALTVDSSLPASLTQHSLGVGRTHIQLGETGATCPDYRGTTSPLSGKNSAL